MTSVADHDTHRRQFVILKHDSPFLHWDFFIEEGTGLASWRLLEFPQDGRLIPTTSLPIHRRKYLTWQGPVSGNRGSVERVFAGSLELDGVWPDSEEWFGLTMRMPERRPAPSCTLIRHGDGALFWKFG